VSDGDRRDPKTSFNSSFYNERFHKRVYPKADAEGKTNCDYYCNTDYSFHIPPRAERDTYYTYYVRCGGIYYLKRSSYGKQKIFKERQRIYLCCVRQRGFTARLHLAQPLPILPLLFAR
jgi:hypothetical protein